MINLDPLSFDANGSGIEKFTPLIYSSQLANFQVSLVEFLAIILSWQVSGVALTQMKANSQFNVANLSEKVEDQEDKVLMNLMASADLFEMVLAMIGENTINISTLSESKKGNSIIEVYTTLVSKGKKTIDEVPVMIKSKVEEMLKVNSLNGGR